jgi:RNA methyltransferase, TrmH family
MMFSKTHTKYIQSLHHKKFRDEFGVFIAEGPKVVMELLDSREFICKEIFALPEWITANATIAMKYSIGAVIAIKDFELEKITALSTSNKVLAVFEKKQQAATPDLANKITLALDTIQDPGNLGTIIRIADWFGVDNIICSPGCADMYSPKVVQSTMGSLARINMVYTDIATWIKDNGNIMVYAATMQGKDVRALSKIKEGIIIIGNEGKGINEELLSLAKENITIPKMGEAESLNAAVATGIILSHVS